MAALGKGFILEFFHTVFSELGRRLRIRREKVAEKDHAVLKAMAERREADLRRWEEEEREHRRQAYVRRIVEVDDNPYEEE